MFAAPCVGVAVSLSPEPPTVGRARLLAGALGRTGAARHGTRGGACRWLGAAVLCRRAEPQERGYAGQRRPAVPGAPAEEWGRPFSVPPLSPSDFLWPGGKFKAQ